MAINALTVQDTGDTRVEDWIKLRDTRPFRTENRAYYDPRKSVFSRIVGEARAGGFELTFASFLDRPDNGVAGHARRSCGELHGIPELSLARRGESSYNDHMAKRPRTVGARELKTRFGTYLDQVKRGATIVVTDRGQPVAELRPIDEPEDRLDAALRRMEAEGLLTRAKKRGPLTPFTPIKLPPGSPSIAETIAEDREDRF